MFLEVPIKDQAVTFSNSWMFFSRAAILDVLISAIYFNTSGLSQSILDKICRRSMYRHIYICQIGVQVIFTIYCIFQNDGQAKLQRISIKQEMRRKKQLDNIFERYKKPFLEFFGMLGGIIFKLFSYLQDIWSIIHTNQFIPFFCRWCFNQIWQALPDHTANEAYQFEFQWIEVLLRYNLSSNLRSTLKLKFVLLSLLSRKPKILSWQPYVAWFNWSSVHNFLRIDQH